MRQEIISGRENWSEAVVVVPPIANYRDATDNDSDKSIAVPGNELWKVLSACVFLDTSADAGNRIMTVEIINADGDVIKHVTAGAVQAANTSVDYCFAQGTYRETTVVNGTLQIPFPFEMYLLPGFALRFYDSAAIAAAADDMTVNLQYVRMLV